MFIPFNFPLPEGDIHAKRSPLFIDWSNPITQGLSWFMCSDGSTTDPNFSTQGLGPGFSLRGGGFFTQGKKGSAYSGTGSTSGLAIDQSAGYSFPILSSVPGTVAAFVSASFSPTDGVSHAPFEFGNSGPAGISVSANKFSDNNWYIGFLTVSGNDNRVTVPATGTFSAGDDFLVAATWDTVNTTAWVKGANIGATATGLSRTTSNGIGIGDSSFFGNANSWARSPGDNVYWAACWTRQLQATEIIYLNANPFCFILNPNSLVMSMTGYQWEDLDNDKKFPVAHWRREVMAHD